MDSGGTKEHEAEDQLDNGTSATRRVNGNKREATIQCFPPASRVLGAGHADNDHPSISISLREEAVTQPIPQMETLRLGEVPCD